MATVDIVEIPQDDKEAALECIINYARQNPEKYKGKKDALMAKYGITTLEDSVVEVPESEDVKELKAIKKKVNK